jgi:hypothetical protein
VRRVIVANRLVDEADGESGVGESR